MKLFSIFLIGTLSAANAFSNVRAERITYDCTTNESVAFVLDRFIDMDGLSSYAVNGKYFNESQFDMREFRNGHLQVWFLGYPGEDEQLNICAPRIED